MLACLDAYIQSNRISIAKLTQFFPLWLWDKDKDRLEISEWIIWSWITNLKFRNAFEECTKFGMATWTCNLRNRLVFVDINDMIVALIHQMPEHVDFALKYQFNFIRSARIPATNRSWNSPRAAKLRTYLSISRVFSGWVACIETSLPVRYSSSRYARLTPVSSINWISAFRPCDRAHAKCKTLWPCSS